MNPTSFPNQQNNNNAIGDTLPTSMTNPNGQNLSTTNPQQTSNPFLNNTAVVSGTANNSLNHNSANRNTLRNQPMEPSFTNAVAAPNGMTGNPNFTVNSMPGNSAAPLSQLATVSPFRPHEKAPLVMQAYHNNNSIQNHDVMDTAPQISSNNTRGSSVAASLPSAVHNDQNINANAPTSTTGSLLPQYNQSNTNHQNTPNSQNPQSTNASSLNHQQLTSTSTLPQQQTSAQLSGAIQTTVENQQQRTSEENSNNTAASSTLDATNNSDGAPPANSDAPVQQQQQETAPNSAPSEQSNKRPREQSDKDLDPTQLPATKKHMLSFDALDPNIIISILSFIEQTISIDYQHRLFLTTLPREKRWDPHGRDWMIFDLRRRFPTETRMQPWIATRQDMLIFSLYGRFKSDETRTPRLLWTSLQFACPYPDQAYREQMNNAIACFSCTDYIPWAQVVGLRLSGCFTPYSLKYLRYTQKLEYLSIEAERADMPYYQVTNRCIAVLPKNLQYLDLSFVNVDEKGVRKLFERLTKLKVVGLNGIRGGIHKVSTARLINQSPQLTQLELRQNDIGDAVAQELFKNSRLSFLNLSENLVTPKGWAGLRYNTSVYTLHFFNSQINDDFLELIRAHPHVKDVHMEGCLGATDVGIRRLLTELPTKISSISLARCAISSQALIGISLNDTLKSLYLDFNPNLGVEVFGELSRVRQLRDLSVVGCQLTDEHIHALLHNNFSLRNLFLSHNNQLGWGCINALIDNISVTYVILADCEGINDEMVDKLVSRNTSLRQLVLDSNKQLSDKAMASIEKNHSLSTISAFGTKFSEDIHKKIVNDCPNILAYNSNVGDFLRAE